MDYEHLYADLRLTTKSNESSEFIANLTAMADGKGSKPFTAATAALIGDLLDAASIDANLYRYRPFGRSTFTGEAIGFRGFDRARKLLQSRGYIDLVAGHSRKRGKGLCTRFRATPLLIDAAASAGIALSDLSLHFETRPRPKRVANPVRCTTSATGIAGYNRVRGEAMPVNDRHHVVMDSRMKIEFVNEFMADQRITPDKHSGLYRLFHEGDKVGHNYQFGGRIYSGGLSYQQMPSGEKVTEREPGKLYRFDTEFDGEASVEIDIKASFPTIVHAEHGLPCDPQTIYDVPDLPRAIVKAWMVMAFAKSNLPSRWPAAQRKRLLEKSGIDVKKHPIKDVTKAIVAHVPIFAQWEKYQIHWGRLQFIESSAMLDCIFELAKMGIPSLPIHDSIIVPRSKESKARDVLARCFKKHSGVDPIIDTKTPVLMKKPL